MIDKKEYARIIDLMPIVCIDAVIQNEKGEYLLVKRSNEPLKGVWWVPGGRVLKGEGLEQTVIRKIQEELNASIKDMAFLGVYEDQFDTTPFEEVKTGVHTVSLVFRVNLESYEIKLDSQSSEYKFFDKLPERFKVIPFNA